MQLWDSEIAHWNVSTNMCSMSLKKNRWNIYYTKVKSSCYINTFHESDQTVHLNLCVYLT